MPPGTFQAVVVLIIFFIPGIIILSIIDRFVTRPRLSDTGRFLRAALYSLINYSLLLPFWGLWNGRLQSVIENWGNVEFKGSDVIFVFIAIVALPTVLGFIIVIASAFNWNDKLYNFLFQDKEVSGREEGKSRSPSRKLRGFLRKTLGPIARSSPEPTAWDYIVSHGISPLVLLKMKESAGGPRWVAGWLEQCCSYGQIKNDCFDLYCSCLYELDGDDKHPKILSAKKLDPGLVTNGGYFRSDNIEYIEFYDLEDPKQWAQIGDEAIEPFIEQLKDTRGDRQAIAATALGEIGDERAVDPLIKALKNYDSQVRSRAAKALGELENSAAIEPLTRAQEDPDEEVRNAAEEALRKLGNRDEKQGSDL